jgi:cell division protein ZapA
MLAPTLLGMTKINVGSGFARNDKEYFQTRLTAMATATKESTVKDTQSASVRVEIFDQAYNLRGSDPEYILKLAEYVDSKMRAVAEATNTIDTVRLAVLAALNIADEYHLLKRKQDSGATDYQKRAHLLADALDEVLDEKRKAG